MNARNRYFVNILSTGILVMVLTLTGLFWARWHLHLVRAAAVQEMTVKVQIRPTGLFPFEKADDPNLVSPSSATVEFSAVFALFTNLGAPHYVLSHLSPGPDSNMYRWEAAEDGVRFYFDSSRGLMVYGRMSDVKDPNGTTRRRYVAQFAGPEGIGETPDASLGRFASPISDGYYENNPQTVYDKGQRRFFVVRWRDGLVRKGPEIPEGDEFDPIQLGLPSKDFPSLRMMQNDAVYKRPGGDGLVPGRVIQALYPQWPRMDSWPTLVLNASGRIDLLNLDTLALTRDVGHIPAPRPFFQNDRGLARPEDVTAYSVQPLGVYQRDADKKWVYIGCIAAAASRDLTSVQMAAFDPNGRSVAARAMHASVDDIYLSLPGASLATVVQFLLENLHPAGCLLLSSLTASQAPAESAYRSLVLMPNSFAAMAARDADLAYANRLAYSLLFMAPAIGLGVFLAWRVSRDAARMGLSKREGTLWILGAFALGLPAYVTYRLTRPTVALVTCANCGQGRRADFEKCQRCRAPWSVPELIPPAWRVLGEPESVEDTLPSPAQETSQSA
jgi:hypothetical protein